jgi:hypothetical protein
MKGSKLALWNIGSVQIYLVCAQIHIFYWHWVSLIEIASGNGSHSYEHPYGSAPIGIGSMEAIFSGIELALRESIRHCSYLLTLICG